jgi:hypothetical protein
MNIGPKTEVTLLGRFDSVHFCSETEVESLVLRDGERLQSAGQPLHSRPSKLARVEVAKHSILPQLVDTRRASEILGRSPATLKRWRCQGTGPSWIEIEGRVSYDLAVLVEYIRENTRVPSVRAAMEESRGIV